MVGVVNSISDFFLGKELESGLAAAIQLYHWHQVHQKLRMHCQILVGVKFGWKWQTKKEKAVVENIKDVFIVMFLGSIMWVKICMYLLQKWFHPTLYMYFSFYTYFKVWQARRLMREIGLHGCLTSIDC